MKLYHIYNNQGDNRYILVHDNGDETEIEYFNPTDVFSFDGDFYLAYHHDNKWDSEGVSRKEYVLRKATIRDLG